MESVTVLTKGMNLFPNVHQLLIAAGKHILETINMPVPVAHKILLP